MCGPDNAHPALPAIKARRARCEWNVPREYITRREKLQPWEPVMKGIKPTSYLNNTIIYTEPPPAAGRAGALPGRGCGRGAMAGGGGLGCAYPAPWGAGPGGTCSVEATRLPALLPTPLSSWCPGHERRGPFSPGSLSGFPPPCLSCPLGNDRARPWRSHPTVGRGAGEPASASQAHWDGDVWQVAW